MENNIQKPVSIAKNDFINELVGLINNSGLPLEFIEYIVRDLLNEIHTSCTRKLQEDTKSFNAQLDEISREISQSKQAQEVENDEAQVVVDEE